MAGEPTSKSLPLARGRDKVVIGQLRVEGNRDAARVASCTDRQQCWLRRRSGGPNAWNARASQSI